MNARLTWILAAVAGVFALSTAALCLVCCVLVIRSRPADPRPVVVAAAPEAHAEVEKSPAKPMPPSDKKKGVPEVKGAAEPPLKTFSLADVSKFNWHDLKPKQVGTFHLKKPGGEFIEFTVRRVLSPTEALVFGGPIFGARYAFEKTVIFSNIDTSEYFDGKDQLYFPDVYETRVRQLNGQSHIEFRRIGKIGDAK